MNLRRLLPFILFSLTSCTPPIREKEPEITLFSSTWKGDSAILASDRAENLPKVTQIENGSMKIFCWWEIYGDLKLNQLEFDAISNSPTLEIALIRLQEALCTLGIHESDLYPTLSLSSEFSRKKIAKDLRPVIPVPVIGSNGMAVESQRGPKRNTFLDLSFVLQYEIDLWGRLRLIQDSYRSLAQASLYDVQSIQLILTHQVAKLYNAIRYYDIDLKSAEVLLNCMQENIELIQKKYENGIESLVPSLQIESRKEALLAEIADLKSLREQAITALACLLGKDPTSFAMPQYEPIWHSVTPPHIIPMQVLAQRPDVQKSLAEINSSISQIGIMKTEYLPTLSLTGLLGFDSTKTDRLFAWKNHIWAIGNSLNMNLLDAGRKKSQVQAATAAYRAKAQEHIQICLQAIQEVEDSLAQYTASEQKLQASTQKAIHNEHHLFLENGRFCSGLIAYQDVLSVKEGKISSMRAQLHSQYQLQLASLDIVKAIGGSWAKLNPEKEPTH